MAAKFEILFIYRFTASFVYYALTLDSGTLIPGTVYNKSYGDGVYWTYVNNNMSYYISVEIEIWNKILVSKFLILRSRL